MVLILHVSIAISSLLYAAYLFFQPSKKKVYIAYVLVALTFISGTYLIFLKPSHLVQSCIMGLIYLGVILPGIIFANIKLAKSESKSPSV